MKSSPHAIERAPKTIGGFTLVEILIVIGIIGLLAAVALPSYQRYVARSQAAELALKYDAVRTAIQVSAKSGEIHAACGNLASTVQPANLQSSYAQLALNFDAVPGGFSPVLTICAAAATQGQRGVEVAREAHNLLMRNSTIGQGAVIGESAVSFSVKLAGDTALCKVLPPAGTAKAACGKATGSSDNTVVTPPKPGNITPNIPASGASAPQGPVSTPQKPVTTTTNTASSCNAGPVNLGVMRFSGNNRVSSAGNLNTNGDMTALSAEVVFTGGPGNDPLATLLSYSTDAAYRGFTVYDPSNVHISLAGRSYASGVNLEDGQNHRLTVSWQQAGGTLVLYDNGREVWRRAGVNSGGTVAGNGRLTIGQEDYSAVMGSTSYRSGYVGSIVSASLATTAVTAAQAASDGLHNVLASSLVTDVVMGPNGQPIDTTGRATYTSVGGVTSQKAPVDTSIIRDKRCP
ncbi:prepilin-type N-terminal cleavage/methylation domain-containing protein [Undibacterium parvum]|uniref:Prepilin-type N-terminal cleavage/methylation domain-containing protein n=2 Tax=Undibacterium TaxID=401469 RepID=A0A6M4A943_9BURK|nr:prepilin-type N-terminal cleavage/methylation domain-containing protein [Undibacterium parvum]AZP12275.1 prepilin-type N-terminal cleavage/methylation domain-containing protein [Undibacterium parvum]QJQ06559.1 prepilin-type N-terminal cleavage/methylation domain-containing protein [Undibacterium piscinae]